MNHDALLKLWNPDEIPVCDEGMKLAQAFLVSSGEAVDRLGVEEPADRITELTAAYMALVEHGVECDKCSETDSYSNNPWKAANLATMPERDDIPKDPAGGEKEYPVNRV
jgi:hypothetical protein